ncbi:CheR family methyltransferase [Aquibacillus albus]|uniref:protein-glutamate O-methyltransferase n=1 Tax=Aquibacillus albus TaxID=1168171 RepID=A0ABS2MV99_9BACI|nr:protein-glutamate O-methyltransferase CheR [Aquibacillus albus]MBM7569827.1 chemotaxis protein methyltransferase CheR [Aquibacillus albus]
MGDYHEFIILVQRKTGIDLSLYKEVQMKRRLTSLRNKKGFSDFSSYFQAISEDQELFDEFLDKITINVSEFFRNYSRWKVLEEKVVPMLVKKNRPLKIWSAACSTGEEPYTIAIILSQYTDVSNIRILATDIDANVLDQARMGRYRENSLQDVPKSMLNIHFTRSGDFYQVNQNIKKCVTFRSHNLLSDPYPANFDLIVCRNVLIYFTEEAKHNIYQKFSQSLFDGGVFFVGSTEQIFNPHQYDFRVLDTFFYQKQ